MKYLKILIVLHFLLLGNFLHAEIASSKRAEIDQLFRLTGMEKLMQQVFDQMTQQLRAGRPDMPSEFWAKFDEKIKVAELLDMVAVIYDKHYTEEDLKAVNAFYSSEAGQKVLATLPAVMQECMEVGAKWGEKIGAQIESEMRSQKR